MIWIFTRFPVLLSFCIMWQVLSFTFSFFLSFFIFFWCFKVSKSGSPKFFVFAPQAAPPLRSQSNIYFQSFFLLRPLLFISFYLLPDVFIALKFSTWLIFLPLPSFCFSPFWVLRYSRFVISQGWNFAKFSVENRFHLFFKIVFLRLSISKKNWFFIGFNVFNFKKNFLKRYFKNNY